MAKRYLVCVYSVDSGRHAILADDGVIGVLYLHAPSTDPTKTGGVEGAGFAFNRKPPVGLGEVAGFQPGPPPIAKGSASPEAVCVEPMGHRWRLKFSADGSAVLLTRDAEPWVVVSLATPRGFSRAVAKPGPWGKPWSDDVYEETDWTGRTKRCT